MAKSLESETRRAGTRFLILFPGRTGSSWLVSALKTHPQVRAEGEILVKQDAKAQQRLFVDLHATPPPPGHAAGFKTKLKDVADLDDLRRRIDGTPLAVILMRRSDLVRLAISRITARRLHQHSGRWNLDDRTSAAPTRPIDAAELIEAIEHCDRTVRELEEFLAGFDAPRLDLEYAQILAEPTATLDRVQAFLGVPPHPLQSGVRKNTDEDLHRAVPNLPELLAAIGASRWAPLLSRFDASREAPPQD